MGITISMPGIWTPPEDKANIIYNSDLEKLIETTNDWIIKRTGIEQRRISFEMNLNDMALKAVMDLQKKTGFNPEEIDQIIFATNKYNKDITFPTPASYIASEIGARKDIPRYSTEAGCTNHVYALKQACDSIYSSEMYTQKINKVLVVIAERLTDMTDYSDRNTCILFGDAAAAYLVESDDKQCMLNIVTGGESDNGNEEWKNGLLTMKRNDEGVKLGQRDKEGNFTTYKKDQNYLIMNGKEVYKFATRVLRKSVVDVLKGTPYLIENVDMIIPHGANKRITDSNTKFFEGQGFTGQIYTNLERYGNTSGPSIALAEAEAIEKGLLKHGDLVVQTGFGAGFTYGAMLKRVVLPEKLR